MRSKEKKRTLRLKLGSTFYLPMKTKERHHMQSIYQFLEYFLPRKYNYIFVDPTQTSDITIWDIYQNDNQQVREDEINMLICVENVDHWNLEAYKHYRTYGNYENPKMHIYLYNHIDRIRATETSVAIPTVHTYIQYYQRNALRIQPSIYVPFSSKRFCLYMKRYRSEETNSIYDTLSTIAPVDHISQYENIMDKSCYHSVELLNIMQSYKFIMCFENSYKDGYITEKIFNCFFSKSIPIYKGSEKVHQYFAEGSYIDARQENWIELVRILMENEELYTKYTQTQKISNRYDNEEYQERMVEFIEHRLSISC